MRMGQQKAEIQLSLAVEKRLRESGTILVNMDSQAPNKVVKGGHWRAAILNVKTSAAMSDDADYAADIKPEKP